MEDIISRLSDGNLGIDESVSLYEEGVKLATLCAGELEAAKRKIQILQQGADGEIEVVDVPEGTFSEEE
jgi:exodeoxyribonuclease VII small subunit